MHMTASAHTEGFLHVPRGQSGASMGWLYGVSEDRWITVWSPVALVWIIGRVIGGPGFESEF